MAKISSKEKLEKFSIFRQHQMELLKSGKISLFDFSDATFHYFYQNRQRNKPKANDVHSIVFNYFYWLTQIERRAAKERRLIAYDLGSVDTFFELSDVFIKRRDQMVRRLFDRLNYKLEDAYLVFGTTIEVKIKGLPFLFYCQKDSLSRSDIEVQKLGPSENPEYIPLLDIEKHIQL